MTDNQELKFIQELIQFGKPRDTLEYVLKKQQELYSE